MREPELPLYDIAKKVPAPSKTDSNPTAPSPAALAPGYAINLAARHKPPNEELAGSSTADPVATPIGVQTANASCNKSTAVVPKIEEPQPIVSLDFPLVKQ